MARTSYELTESFGGFEAGALLDVTARFGDWHEYDLKLEPARPNPQAPAVFVTESESGFSEAEILDETARFGDWHEYDLAFDPVSGDADSDGMSGPIRVTMAAFERVAAPVDTTA